MKTINCQISTPRRVRGPAYRGVFQRLGAALECEDKRRRDDPKWRWREDEKLTQAQLALFGSAPK